MKGEPRLVHMFEFQEEPKVINAYSDTDYAGCIRTRRSTRLRRTLLYGTRPDEM